MTPEQDANAKGKNDNENPKPTKLKKPYQDPAFRYEKVFETMALTCGKTQPTTFECKFHRQAS
jgi:hypothetical protein